MGQLYGRLDVKLVEENGFVYVECRNECAGGVSLLKVKRCKKCRVTLESMRLFENVPVENTSPNNEDTLLFVKRHSEKSSLELVAYIRLSSAVQSLFC